MIRDEATAAVSASTLARVDTISAPDEDTVELTLSAPDSGLFANLATLNMAMLSLDDTEEQLNTTLNGTGPFTFQDRVANQSVTLARNDAYWGEPALLDTVEFRVIPDESSIVSALQSGNVQMAAEAALSFLGLGTPPPAPSLGSMIYEARTLVTVAPWTMLAPGFVVVALVAGLNLLGDGLRDFYDPRNRGTR